MITVNNWKFGHFFQYRKLGMLFPSASHSYLTVLT